MCSFYQTLFFSSSPTYSSHHIWNTLSFRPMVGSLKLGSSAPNATIFFFRRVLTICIQPQSTRGCGHLSGPGSQCLGTGLLNARPTLCGKGNSQNTNTFVTSCPMGMSLPADCYCEGMVSLHFTQSGFLIPATAGVVVEKGSEYILVHTGQKELDGHPLGGCGLGFGLFVGYNTLSVRVQTNINLVPSK